MKTSEGLADLTRSIRAAKRIALLMHVSPDGDACGTALALRRALLLLDKDVTVVCDHRVPHIYEDLEGAAEVVAPDTLKGVSFDLAFAVDVADRTRLGEAVGVFDAAAHTAQIDHHGTNPGYAQINYLRSPLSATAVLALDVIDALGVALDQCIAKCLFVGVTTDTGNFKQQNTDAEALQVAARCIRTGIDTAAITRRVFDLRPIQQIKLMARALESLAVYADGRIAIMRLGAEDFAQTGALAEHTEGIINFAINTEGVQMACMLSQPGEKIRCSLRSLPPYDVAAVAAVLGGGGHQLAAGCTMEPPLDEAAEKMRAEMTKEMKRHC